MQGLINHSIALQLADNSTTNDVNNNSNATDAPPISPEDESTLATIEAMRSFNFWFLLILIIIGFLGNSFAIIIISISSQLRRVSSNHYLIALALSDNVFVFGLFLIWLDKAGLRSYHRNDAACKFVLFLLNSSGCLSALYVMILTIERFIVVYYPLYRQAICSVGRTRRAIVILAPWPLLFNIWIVFAAGAHPEYGGKCDILPDYYRMSLVFNSIDAGISFVIPVLVIVSLNAAICVRLLSRDQRAFAAARPPVGDRIRFATTARFNKLKHRFVSAERAADNKSGDEDDPGADNVRLTPISKAGGRAAAAASSTKDVEEASIMRKHAGSNAKMQNQERKITKTLLIISFVYVILNTPSYSVRLLDNVMAAAGASPTDVTLAETIVRNVFLLIYYTNFALNFLVYSLSSKNFREVAKNILVRKQVSPPTTSTNTAYSYVSRSTSVRHRAQPSTRTPSPCPNDPAPTALITCDIDLTTNTPRDETVEQVTTIPNTNGSTSTTLFII